MTALILTLTYNDVPQHSGALAHQNELVGGVADWVINNTISQDL